MGSDREVVMAAPTRPRMRKACSQAADHYRREHIDAGAATVDVQVMVDRVPQFTPGIADGANWYKVGSLLVEPAGDMLYIYLSADSGAVKLEQVPEDVVPNRAPDRES
jgi:hypothetical protein